MALVVLLGAWLWRGYAHAWDLGKGSPVLGYDAAQYAVAARELSDHGRLATLFALPLELSRHATPPWPLALVQPGLVLAEAALFELGGPHAARADMPETREAWALVLPCVTYLAIAVLLLIGTGAVIARLSPNLSARVRGAAGLVVAIAFLLDPDAQHFAVGGFTELPFTLGLVAALILLALGHAERRPFLFGLLLGVTGAFRANMLWFAPLLALGVAWIAPRERRVASFVRVLAGYALPLVPWWLYKWRVFGTPAWDLSWVSLWDGLGGRTWFSLNHLPELPELPTGRAAFATVAAKLARNVPNLLLELSRGPRALWLGSLAIALLAFRGDDTRRAPRAAGIIALAITALSLVVTAVSVPVSRYLFPARVAAEACGIVALGALIASAPEVLLGSITRRIAFAAVALLALGWGGFRTLEGLSQAQITSEARGIPSTPAMLDLVARLDRELGPGEPVMSNLGPVLAWYGRRPVVHLALTPADIDACRRRLDLHVVLLVFREPARAWPEWREVLERPDEAAHHPEWNISKAVRFDTTDGFVAVWLELGALGSPLAGR